MARGDARRRVGEVMAPTGSSRTFCGKTTVSGDSENGYRITLPINPARGEGIKAGDELFVEHDPASREFVFRHPEKKQPVGDD